MPVIECRNVSKTFRRNAGRALLRERITQAFSRRRREKFYALRNVSFEVESGDGVAVIGRNGAGKSTLLSLICGLVEPDQGSIRVEGRIAPLLELGAGFHQDLTGRENLFLNAALMGFNQKEVEAKYEEIVEFSGLHEFMDEPIRTYSSGMVMRLAFSVATNVAPDILIVDEVLGVGDQVFMAKCWERLTELRGMGKTFLCVAHSAGIIKDLCDRAIWLDKGEVMMEGPTGDVLDAYQGRHLSAEIRG